MIIIKEINIVSVPPDFCETDHGFNQSNSYAEVKYFYQDISDSDEIKSYTDSLEHTLTQVIYFNNNDESVENKIIDKIVDVVLEHINREKDAFDKLVNTHYYLFKTDVFNPLDCFSIQLLEETALYKRLKEALLKRIVN